MAQLDHSFARRDRVVKHRHEEAGKADLYVLTTVFNPVRYRSRWKLAEDFFKRVKESGAKLCVAEVAFGNRDFVLNDGPIIPDIYLPITSDSFVWLKEASLNALLARVPLTAQYIAECDADIGFARDDWANEIVQALQHYDVIQPWSEADDLGPHHTTIGRHHSFIYSWLHDEKPTPGGNYYQPAPGPLGYSLYHPGFARAWRRTAIDTCGGFIDFAILGAADRHMMAGLIGEIEGKDGRFWKFHPDLTPGYMNALRQWEHNAQALKKNLGYIDGKLLHYWHGSKRNRRYIDRWKILVDHQFDPQIDLKYDWQGIPQLVVESPRQIALRDKCRIYFTQRDEDATSE